MRILVLISTIPPRRRSCQRLLAEMTKQTRVPDGLVLVLDGYGDAPAPEHSLPLFHQVRTHEPVGAGLRWRVASELSREDVVVVLDDDIVTIEAPKLIEKLVAAVGDDEKRAASAMGRTRDGKPAPPGGASRGQLLHAAGCSLTVRPGQLSGLTEFAEQVRAAGGPDALNQVGGDDDALVSAHLWKSGVQVIHAPAGNIYPAPGTQESSQTRANRRRGVKPDAQKTAIAKATGWPWVAQKRTVIGGR